MTKNGPFVYFCPFWPGFGEPQKGNKESHTKSWTNISFFQIDTRHGILVIITTTRGERLTCKQVEKPNIHVLQWEKVKIRISRQQNKPPRNQCTIFIQKICS